MLVRAELRLAARPALPQIPRGSPNGWDDRVRERP